MKEIIKDFSPKKKEKSLFLVLLGIALIFGGGYGALIFAFHIADAFRSTNTPTYRVVKISDDKNVTYDQFDRVVEIRYITDSTYANYTVHIHHIVYDEKDMRQDSVEEFSRPSTDEDGRDVDMEQKTYHYYLNYDSAKSKKLISSLSK